MTTNESAVLYLKYNHDIMPERIFAFATEKIMGPIIEDKKSEKADGKGKQSEKVAGKADQAEEEDGKLTHLEYFQNRLREDGLPVDEIMPLNYNDGKSEDVHGDGALNIFLCQNFEETEQSLQSSIGMASMIIQYVRKNHLEPEDYVLDVDLTGGMRDALMILLSVMHLLQYRGFTIGHVLYSRWNPSKDTIGKQQIGGRGTVLEAEEIYRLQDFVSGAAEFTRYGSVKEIKAYFAGKNKNISPALRALLNAMDGFSDAIKLSQRDEFKEAINQLKTSLETFHDAFQKKAETMKRELASSFQLMAEEDRYDALTRIIENRIEKDYKELLASPDDDLAKIRWCLRHDYLQQALTLYTECIPEFLFDRGIFSLSDEQKKPIREEMKKRGEQRSLHFYVINAYGNEPKSKFYEQNRKWKEIMKDFGIRFGKERQKGQLYQTYLSEVWRRQKDGNRGNHFHEEKDRIFLDRECQWEDVKKSLPGNGNPQNLYHEVKQKMSEDHIYLKSPDASIQFMSKIIDILKKGQSKEVNEMIGNLKGGKYSIEDIGGAWTLPDDIKHAPRCGRIYKLIKEDNGLTCHVGEALCSQLWSVLEGYYEIKMIRNDSAHARLERNGEVLNFQEVKQKIEENLKDLAELASAVGQHQEKK